MINPIPNSWKQTIKQNKNQDIQNQQVGEIIPSKIQGNSKICKKVYNEIIQMQIDMGQISGITKWRNYFRGDITTDEWINSIDNLYKTTRHTDLLYFQYKLVHFILTTNENLFRCNMTDSDICAWCQEEIETIPHIFLECEVVKSFWSDIKHWICQKTNILININNKELNTGHE